MTIEAFPDFCREYWPRTRHALEQGTCHPAPVRRVGLYYWKQWKQPRTRRRNLIQLGANPEEVKLASRSRKGYWRMSSPDRLGASGCNRP